MENPNRDPELLEVAEFLHFDIKGGTILPVLREAFDLLTEGERQLWKTSKAEEKASLLAEAISRLN